MTDILNEGAENFQLTIPKISDTVIHNKIDTKGIILLAEGKVILLIFNSDGFISGMSELNIPENDKFSELDDSTYIFVDVTLNDVFVTSNILKFYKVDMPVVDYFNRLGNINMNFMPNLYQKLMEDLEPSLVS